MTTPADPDPETREACAKAIWYMPQGEQTSVPDSWDAAHPESQGINYQMADAVLRVLAERGMLAGGWIKCSERMPAFHERALVAGYARNHGHPVAALVDRDVQWITGAGKDLYWSTSAGPMRPDCVTHWMPLPPPPGAGNGGKAAT